MTKFVVISSAVLSLILGIALPAYAQQDQKNDKQDQHKQKQEEEKQAKGQQHAQQPQNRDKQQHQVQQQQQQSQDRQQQQVKQQKQDQSRQQEQRIQQMQNQDRQQQQGRQQQQRQDQSRQQQQVERHQNQDRQEQARQQRPERDQDQQRVWQSTWQNHRASSWQSDHRSWRQRGGYDGYRIPQDRYRGYFGPQHWFRISGRPFMVYGGYPRFQYEGYWITLLDPWPEYWSNDWYDNDDVYVDYRDDGYYMYNRRYPDAAIAISISM